MKQEKFYHYSLQNLIQKQIDIKKALIYKAFFLYFYDPYMHL